MITKAGRLGLAASAALILLSACTAPGPDCTGMVGNTKKKCEADSKSTRAPDNSNNPGS